MTILPQITKKKTPVKDKIASQNSTANYWSVEPKQLLSLLHSSPEGLQPTDAEQRLKQYGLNTIGAQQKATAFRLLLSQFKSPLVLILIVAAIISGVLGEWVDTIIVLVIVLSSTLLGFVQEYAAGNAVEKLRSQVTLKTNVLRGGKATMIPSERVVPGDVVILSAGSLIPADGVVLEADDFFVNQAVLTGETFPSEKKVAIVAANASLSERINSVFMGTSVSSGTARVIIAQTGKTTVFGQVAEKLRLRPPETEFERGIKRFGNMLTQVMLVMVIVVLAVNVLMKKPVVDSLLFALALAVGLTPELLPAIISIMLSHGAQKMAKRGVIVRRLNAIENFGSMDFLCTDKTGTLTEGVVSLDGAMDAQGQPSEDVLRFAYLNANYQAGLVNALDEAIQASATKAKLDITAFQKVDEIPYDFIRKRLSMIVADPDGECTLITKGALDNILAVCTNLRVKDGTHPLDAGARSEIIKLYSDWSEKGYRVLGVATKSIDKRSESYTYKDEAALSFTGFLLFFDPPKKDVEKVILDLLKRGVQLKIITGDNQKVALHVATAVKLPVGGVLTGSQLNDLTDEALWHLAEKTTIFAEVDPNQKERIILALKKTKHVVGYMGDGINDAPALHAADVGISVDTAVDVAKEAADFVLLNKDLAILSQGIDEGRITFGNTMKYILTTISANFGNMFSMAGASMFLSFLPLLAPQILLNNFLSDIPAITIASDNVDKEMTAKPRRWNTKFITKYMVTFGLVSSVFDFLVFGTLLLIFKATPEEFRTGWFIASLLTELVIALVVRTRHLFFRSRPSTMLLTITLIFVAITLAIPYLPFTKIFGFIPLPAPLLLAVIGLTALYVVATEITKKFFYAKADNASA